MSSTHHGSPTPLEAVLMRLQGSSGFPTLSSTISDINRVVASESHSTQQITQVILRDVSLTTKLLQVVNSVTYLQFGGHIRTVSKAVLILGGEVLRNVAMTLMMLEFSRGRPQEKSLQDELIGAFFAGVVSETLCRRLGIPNREEAVICTICQSLGRLLVIFFLYEESQQVRSLMQTGLPEEQAAERVLGISYRELGVGVVRHWNFPDHLIEGMQSLAGRVIVAPKSDVEKLNIVVNLAHDLYITALRSPGADQAVALQALSKRYGAAIKLSEAELLEAVRQALKEMAERSTTLNLPAQDSPTLNVVRVWTGGGADGASAGQIDGDASEDPLIRGVAALDALESDTSGVANARQVLFAGIREINETLTTDFALNDVLQMALETMYRGMGFSRAMMFIRDTQHSTMRARFGFGLEIELIVPQCSFPLASGPDVFHLALEKRADIVIEDAQADNIVQRIPKWHRQVISAKSFLLLPVVLQSEVVGLIYADSDRAEGNKINAELLNLLRTLRTQIVLAFKHSGASSRR